MKSHILKTADNYSFEKVGIKGKIFPVDDITDRTGVCLIETENGHETKIIEHKCDFIYYILEGSGIFEIDGQNENFVPGDLVVVPAGSIFFYKGKCKMLLVTTPAFYIEQEETL
ncbi:hypothetical protein KBC75_02485 [Candidatus Shapirobacteria bacterium]|nr:hypothetical protein [Candidatus Shapirobacteria bacterium]